MERVQGAPRILPVFVGRVGLSTDFHTLGVVCELDRQYVSRDEKNVSFVRDAGVRGGV